MAFQITLSFKGQTAVIDDASTDLTPSDLFERTMRAFDLEAGTEVKLLYKGKRLDPTEDAVPLFAEIPKKAPKIMVMATTSKVAQSIANKRSDPTIRGFAQEYARQEALKLSKVPQHWGVTIQQDKNYKFGKLEACTWQSFGHRPTESTPHAFAALQLLEKLSSDPGVIAIMKERELLVNTLGEMDPIDDRLMQKKQQEGGCLLGYNTNRGLRIDIKLRTDDLSGFRPYPELVGTLIHELSHNWVGEHDLLFWTNYAQMRAEYLYEHKYNQSTVVVHGKTTAQLAGLSRDILNNIFHSIMAELVGEMRQHGLHPSMIAPAIEDRCRQLEAQRRNAGKKLGTQDGGSVQDNRSAREKALEAAEKRARENQQNE